MRCCVLPRTEEPYTVRWCPKKKGPGTQPKRPNQTTTQRQIELQQHACQVAVRGFGRARLPFAGRAAWIMDSVRRCVGAVPWLSQSPAPLGLWTRKKIRPHHASSSSAQPSGKRCPKGFPLCPPAAALSLCGGWTYEAGRAESTLLASFALKTRIRTYVYMYHDIV